MRLTLQADRVTKRFGADEPVLRDIELTILPGTLTLVRGHGASGRSTLLRCLAGAYRIDAGSLRLSGDREALALEETDSRTIAWLRRRHLGIVDGRLIAAPREPALAAAARVLEHAAVPAEEVRRRSAQLLEALGLASSADTPVGLLPAYARRAIAVGRGLLSPTSVLLLDEPTHGLGDQATEHLLRLVDGARHAGTAILATGTHDDPVQRIADHALDLQDGAIS